MKCSLTHEKCGAVAAGFWDYGDSCPIRKYQNSSRPGMIDDTCRFYGIARAKSLQRENAQEGADNGKEI